VANIIPCDHIPPMHGKLEGKMKNVLLTNIFFGVLLLALSSCTSQITDNGDFPKVNVPEKTMNTVIQIEELPQFFNSNKNNTPITFHVKNLSNETISFPADTCILIFTKKGGNWLSVVNNMHYQSEIDYLPPFHQDPPGMVIDIFPNIPNMTEPEIIRIVIIGYYNNPEQNHVGAYLDVKLLP
jgi:hypothetical protein